MFVDVLPRWERYAYWIIGLASLGYSYYVLYKEGNRFQSNIAGAYIDTGWKWISRKQDQTDTEWWLWRKQLWMLILFNILHVILSMTLFYFRANEKVRSCLLLMLDISAAVFILGMRPVILLLFQAVIMYLVTFTDSTLLVWFLVMAVVTTLNFDFMLNFQTSTLGLNSDTEYQYIVSSALLYIRLISFATEKIKWRKQKVSDVNSHTNFTKHLGFDEKSAADISVLSVYKQKSSDVCDTKYFTKEEHSRNQSSGLHCDPDLLDLIFYSFYFPLFLDGPIITYNDFHNQIRASFRSDVFSVDVFDIFKRLMRLAFWAFFIDFQFHFLYYCAMSTSDAVINLVSLWSVVIVGYGYGQFFMMKYLCMYGLSLQVSRFDGIKPLPMPRCICWVYSYTDMWKHFDVGLYNFIKHYIYIPLGGSRAGYARQLLASAMAFLFIFWWHGGSLSIFIWCMGNFVTGSLEACMPMLEHSSLGVKVKSFLSPAMQLRLKAISIVPVYVASSLQTLCFFFNERVAKAFLERIVTKATWRELMVEYFFFMAFVQNALYLNARHQAKHCKR